MPASCSCLNSWNTTAALALSLLVVGGVAGLRPEWSYGAVAAIGIALPTETGIFETAGDRGLAIAIGAAIGVCASLLIWPDRAESRFDRHFRAALRATATRLTDALQAATAEREDAAPPDHVSQYHKAMHQAQDALGAVKLAGRAGMQRRLEALRRLYNSVIILDRAAGADIVSTSGNRDLVDEIRQVRRDTCAVLTALADGKRETGDWTRQMDETLGRVQASASQDHPAAELHRNRDTLTFGLTEVRHALADLIEVSTSR